jgi:DNA modification methylase
LFKTLAKNSEHMHMALADYLLQFRKDGDCPRPIKSGISERYNNPDGWITQKEWIEWAAPVWYKQTGDNPDGIRETDVLNVLEAREQNDERHLCPLQLGVCERAIKLWSSPGDLIFDPFSGIGSVGYTALKLNRQYLGFELKESYTNVSVRNMARALVDRHQQEMFD